MASRGWAKAAITASPMVLMTAPSLLLDRLIGLQEMLSHLGESHGVPFHLVKFGGTHQVGEEDGLDSDFQLDIRGQGFLGKKVPEILEGKKVNRP